MTDKPTPSAHVLPSPAKGRVYFLDEVRGFDLILMVAFHAFYVVGWLFNIAWGQTLFLFFQPVEPFFAGLFILICGISCRLSHSNVKRGTWLALIAIGISAILWLFLRKEMIWFGILHFLATAILLFALLRPALDRVPPPVGLLVCALLFLLTWGVPEHNGYGFGIPGLLSWRLPESLTSQWWLYPLGIGNGVGSDYFPILPWIFCFLGGSFLGVWVRQGRCPGWMYKNRAPWLSWLGRHTLVIYVLHQPVITALCWLILTIAGTR